MQTAIEAMQRSRPGREVGGLSVLGKLRLFYVNHLSLYFGFTGLVNTAAGEALITSLVFTGFPLWAASPLTTYVTIWSDYWLKATFVFGERLSWGRVARYHVNGLTSKAIQIVTTLGLAAFLPFQVSYFLGVVFGFAENYTVATLFTFKSPLQHKLLRPESDKTKLNLGCPYKCEGYICVDLSPKDDGVVRDDAYHYLLYNSPDTYDEIFSKNLLEHLPDVGRFLDECYSSLKPGGRITVVTDNAEFLPYYLPFWVNHTGIGAHSVGAYAEHIEHGHTTHFAVFTKLHLRNLFARSGFVDVRVRRTTFGARLEAVARRASTE